MINHLFSSLRRFVPLAIAAVLLATIVPGCAGLSASVSAQHGGTSATVSMSVPAPEGADE